MVDPQLRVLGVARLRVVDAAVMPSVISGNTNAPVIVRSLSRSLCFCRRSKVVDPCCVAQAIAEKAADLIKQAHAPLRAKL